MPMTFSPGSYAGVFEVLMKICPPELGYYLLCSMTHELA